MNKHRIMGQSKCGCGPRKLIVDDRNINWKNRKRFDPVSEQQSYEISQIPFDKKIEYVARYFKDHCNNCYCHNGLVSPTSKYLYDDENSSSDDDNDESTCTCPLNHPCKVPSSNRSVKLQEHESPAPFLRNKKRLLRGLSKTSRRRCESSCSDKSSYDRLLDNQIDPTGSCVETTSSCVCENNRKDLGSGGFKTRERRRKVIISQEINLSGARIRDAPCSEASCPKKNLKVSYDLEDVKQSLGSITDGLGYTKQRENYELHNSLVVGLKLGINEDEDNVSESLVNDVSDFRDQYYFDTHDPFTKNLPTITNNNSTKPTGLTLIDIDELPCSKEDCLKHKCVYSFKVNNRLRPVPLNKDVLGRCCCDVCNKPMTTVRTDDPNSGKVTKNGSKIGSDINGTLECALETSKLNASTQEENSSAKDSPSELEPQRVHIGYGNERIQLTIPNGLLEEDIGQGGQVTSVGKVSNGRKTTKQGKGANIQQGKSWNNCKGKVNPAERPNSYALRQQKFSMYNKVGNK